MAAPPNEHHVKPIAWVIALGIVAASIAGAVFVTEWKPMTRTRTGTPVALATPPAAKRYHLAMDRPNLPIPLTNDPTEPGSALYTGVSRLLGGDAVGAIEPLNAAVRLSSDAREQDARWYLAVALERAGRVPDALAVLDTIPQGSDPNNRRQQACEGAAALRKP